MVRVGMKSKKKELLYSTSVDASENMVDARDEARATRHSLPATLTNGDTEFRDVGDTVPTDMSGSSDSDPDKSNQSEEVRCTESHEGKLILKQVFPFNIDQLFTMTFTNSKFNMELLAARDIADYVQVPWQPQGEEKVRQISFTQGLNAGPIGPKEVYVTETQIMSKCSKPGRLYSITCTSENAGVPYADSFCVGVHYCFTRVTNTDTELTIIAQIKYKKSIWPMVRAFVDKNTVSGIDDFAKILVRRLNEETDHTVSVRKKRRFRHDAGSSKENSAANSSLLIPRKSISKPPASSQGWLMAALVLLVAINALLLYTLLVDRGYTMDVDDLRNRLKLSAFNTGGDSLQWTRALQRQAERHHAEQANWRAALARTVALLAQTEQALVKLMESLKPSMEEEQQAESRPELWESTSQ